MYSEDTEDDFNTMDRQKQEALLKKTWLDREKQFYGEENDNCNDSIEEQPEEDDSDSDELDRGAGAYDNVVEEILQEEKEEQAQE